MELKKEKSAKRIGFFPGVTYISHFCRMFSLITQFKEETKIKNIDSNLKGKLEDMLVKHGLTDVVPLWIHFLKG